jgi:hypothetical protein
MLNGSLEDNVLTAICWNEELAGEIIERIEARDFSTDTYRRIAAAAIKFYKQHETPARAHIGDLLENEIKRGQDGQFMQEVLSEMERLAPLLNEEYVLGSLDVFLGRQRITKAVNDASDLLVNCQDPATLREACHVLDAAIHPHLDDVITPELELPWPVLDKGALYGLPGEVVGTLGPQTEADRAALLFQFLTAFGNYIGPNVWFEVEAARHHGNLFVIIVGKSAKGRKGTSLRQIRRIFSQRDGQWRKCWFTNALGSGEALIYAVRDKDDDDEDAGSNEKRLFIINEEFATQLRIMERTGSTVSGILRSAWDGEDLVSPLTKSKPIRATDALVSMIGHSTVEDLQRYLTSTDIANGFANRIMFACGKRSDDLLPEGGNLDPADLDTLSAKVERAARYAELYGGEIKFDGPARELWRSAYEWISAEQPGLFGSVVGRAEAQVRRMALLYTVCDQSPMTRADHLLAAISAWSYSFDSARHIFGNATGNGTVADKILAGLRSTAGGMTREDIGKLFSNHQSAQRIGHALDALKQQKHIVCERESTGGRPREVWRAVKR